MERKTYQEQGKQSLMDRSPARDFNRGVAGDATRGEEGAIESHQPQEPQLRLEPNPFLGDFDDRQDRMAEKAGELQSQFEQEIQELDEAEISAAADVKNQVLDRLLPGHARTRAENFVDARETKEWELGASLAELDYQEFGAEEPSNDEAIYEKERRESEREELDLDL